MDCIDCHNRPTHAFEVPERALDKAIKEGLISPTLPFVKKQAVLVLKRDYPDQPTAAVEIPRLLEDVLPVHLPGGPRPEEASGGAARARPSRPSTCATCSRR